MEINFIRVSIFHSSKSYACLGQIPVINILIILHSPFGQAFSLFIHIFSSYFWNGVTSVFFFFFSALENLSLKHEGWKKWVIAMCSFHCCLTPLIRALWAFKCGCFSLHEIHQTISENLVFLPTSTSAQITACRIPPGTVTVKITLDAPIWPLRAGTAWERETGGQLPYSSHGGTHYFWLLCVYIISCWLPSTYCLIFILVGPL